MCCYQEYTYNRENSRSRRGKRASQGNLQSGLLSFQAELLIVVFKPAGPAIIVGKVVAQNQLGVFVLVGTANAFIPAEGLMEPSYL